MKKIFALILAVFILLGNIVSVFAAKSLNELNKEKQDIQNKTSQTQNALNETKNEKNSVLAQVEALDAQLNTVQEELNKLGNQLADTEKKLDENEKALADATNKKENQYESLKHRIKVMYENGSIGYLQVILEADNFTDMLKRVEYINKIAEHDNNIFEEYKRTEALITEKVEEIKVQKENIETLTKEEETKKISLNENIKAKEELVTKLTKDEASFIQQLNDLDKADKEVSNLIVQAQEEIRAKEEAAAKAKAEASKKASGSSSSSKSSTSSKASGSSKSSGSSSSSSGSSSSNKVYTSSGGSLQYPVPAYRGYKYNSPYGSRTNPISGKQEFHTGVDLKATMGTDVVSAESGTVIFAGDKGGYGKCVIVDHGNGLSTLYAHNSQLVVSVGQSVQRGQVISKAGTTGYSTGVHVHFEVRINGQHTNPAGYIGN